MKRLSLRQAQRCETAKGKTCRCRCGGVLHGAMRASDQEAAFYANLPDEDPHKAFAKPPRKKRKKKPKAMPLFDQVESYEPHWPLK